LNDQLSFWILIIGFAIVVYYILVKPLINRLFYNNKTIVGLKAQDSAFIINRFLKHPFLSLVWVLSCIIFINYRTYNIIIINNLFMTISMYLALLLGIYFAVLPFLYAETIPKETEE